MRVDFSIGRKYIHILLTEEHEVRRVGEIQNKHKNERDAESAFIKEFLGKFLIEEVKEAPRDIFSGPLIVDTCNNGDKAYYYLGWVTCNFLDKLKQRQTVIFDNVQN
jgi:hypothetical protein